MTPTDILTLAGATAVVTILTEITKRAASMDDSAVARFGPLIAVVYGVVACVAAAAATSADLPTAALTGLFAGASASGIYSYAKPLVAR